MPRVVIVGAGLMGRHHALAARHLGATVVGVVDRDPAPRDALARLFPAAARTDSIEHLPDAAFDVAHICTRLGSHTAIAHAAAARGAHSLIEKPVAETGDATRRIADLCAAADTLFSPVHQYAFQRGVEDALARLPRLGTVQRIAFDIASAGADNGHFTRDEVVADILPHPLSILQRLLGDHALADLSWHVDRAAAGEWLVSAVAGNTIVTVAISMASRPTRFDTRIYGANGTIEINNFHGFAVQLSGTVSKASKIREPFERAGKNLIGATGNIAMRGLRRESAYPGLRTLFSRFYGAVAGHDATALPISLAQAIDVADARDAILRQVAV